MNHSVIQIKSAAKRPGGKAKDERFTSGALMVSDTQSVLRQRSLKKSLLLMEALQGKYARWQTHRGDDLLRWITRGRSFNQKKVLKTYISNVLHSNLSRTEIENRIYSISSKGEPVHSASGFPYWKRSRVPSRVKEEAFPSTHHPRHSNFETEFLSEQRGGPRILDRVFSFVSPVLFRRDASMKGFFERVRGHWNSSLVSQNHSEMSGSYPMVASGPLSGKKYYKNYQISMPLRVENRFRKGVSAILNRLFFSRKNMLHFFQGISADYLKRDDGSRNRSKRALNLFLPENEVLNRKSSSEPLQYNLFRERLKYRPGSGSQKKENPLRNEKSLSEGQDVFDKQNTDAHKKSEKEESAVASRAREVALLQGVKNALRGLGERDMAPVADTLYQMMQTKFERDLYRRGVV